MSPDQYMRGHSHRQHLTWLAWLDLQWDQPDRSDYYLMQIAREVRRVLHKHPEKVTTEDFKIGFERKDDKPKPPDPQHLANVSAISKAIWASRMTMAITHKVLPNGGQRDGTGETGNPPGG